MSSQVLSTFSFTILVLLKKYSNRYAMSMIAHGYVCTCDSDVGKKCRWVALLVLLVKFVSLPYVLRFVAICRKKINEIVLWLHLWNFLLMTCLVCSCKIMFEVKIILPTDQDTCFYVCFYLLNLHWTHACNIFTCKSNMY